MSAKNRHRWSSEKQPRLEGVAPPSTLKDDFAVLEAKEVLRCSLDVEQLLLMQSVEGHAHAGHGIFYGKTYPNTSQDDVARALRLNPHVVKEDRQGLIDEVMELAERIIQGEDIRSACNMDGEPLMRCGVLRHLQIEPDGLLKGLYAGGLRDDAEIRELANKRYGVQMGYGKCYLVDQNVLKRLGLNGYDLARLPHENEIYEFEKAGLFAVNGDPNIAYMYVRYKAGPGASDDLAIIMAGKLWGFSAAIGCFLADAIDTLEKYVPEYKDQDSTVSEYIEQNYDIKLTKEDAADLAYLCAIPREMQGKLPDCSLRHLLEIDRKADQCPIESHLAYVAGNPFSLMELDHGQCSNAELYEYVEEQLERFNR